MVQPGETEPKNKQELAEHIVAKVKSLGFDIHPHSRLGRIRSIANKGHVDFDLEDEDFLVALESLRETYQLRLIVDTMESHVANKDFLQSVDLMLGDHCLPQKDGKHSPARNRQFQLYLAAICIRAGLK